MSIKRRVHMLRRSAPAPDEGVERGQRQGHVGGDGVVLEVPVVRGEQIQLEVPSPCWRAFSRSTSAAKLVSESITLSIALSRVRSRSSKYKKTRTPASMICFSALGGLDLLAAQTGFLGHDDDLEGGGAVTVRSPPGARPLSRT
jgi:hypothetical protein